MFRWLKPELLRAQLPTALVTRLQAGFLNQYFSILSK